jgi:GRAS domain family
MLIVFQGFQRNNTCKQSIMDFQQLLKHGVTPDSGFSYSYSASIPNSVWSNNNSRKSTYSNSPYSPLSSENLSVGYSPGEATSSHSPLEPNSPFNPPSGYSFNQPAGIISAQSGYEFGPPYVVSCQNMHHALQEIETVLMAPDPEPEEPNLREAKRSRTQSPEYPLGTPVSFVNRPIRQEPLHMVKQLLTRCAEVLNEGRIDEFKMLEQQTRSMVSITGDPVQRVGAYLLEGLVARHENSGTNIYHTLKCREPEGKELLSYMRILYDVCPYFKFGYMAANGAIAEAVRSENRIHIVDFQIAQGTQWITLIQALAARPGGPPHVRITGIDDPISKFARGDGLEVVSKMLQEMSKKFNIPLTFKGLPVYASEVTPEMLDIRPGEALAVNFTLLLHHTPDESVDVNNPRDGLLRMVKSLSPKVTTIVEQESNTNTSLFLNRFMETLDYYSAMFESIDVTLPRESRERINVEQHCLAKDIVNIVACEGKERVERHELLGKWKSRLTMAGFEPYPLSTYVNSVIRKLLACYSDKYTLVETDGAMLLGWKNRNLISASAWH